MKVIEATDAIEVQRTNTVIHGEAGHGKTTLGYMTLDALLLGFDPGYYRTQNRKRTVAIEAWEDTDELFTEKRALLESSRYIVLDTVERALLMLTDKIGRDEPKRLKSGALDPQGWGVLKNRFRTFMARLNGLGKDVVMLAHSRIDKSGDEESYYPDIPGGSYDEVLKIADFVGFLHIEQDKRVLDFSPSSKWVGKNPAGWDTLVVPPWATGATWLSERLEEGRKALGAISAESAAMAAEVNAWRARIDQTVAADAFTALVAEIKAAKPIVHAQAGKLLNTAAKAKGLTWDKDAKKFVPAEAPKEEAAVA